MYFIPFNHPSKQRARGIQLTKKFVHINLNMCNIFLPPFSQRQQEFKISGFTIANGVHYHDCRKRLQTTNKWEDCNCKSGKLKDGNLTKTNKQLHWADDGGGHWEDGGGGHWADGGGGHWAAGVGLAGGCREEAPAWRSGWGPREMEAE